MSASSLQALENARRPVRKAIRRLRWFMGSFREHVEQSAAASGVRFAVDEQRLTAAFLEWLREFEAQKPGRADDRRAFVGFAAGLMLRALIRNAPLRVLSKPEGVDPANPAYFWPEGYAYVAYCLNVRAAVLEQDFHEDSRIAPELSELRSWWSFKENVAEDPSLALAFLDLFAGEEPNWTMPEVFRAPDVRGIASRFYAEGGPGEG